MPAQLASGGAVIVLVFAGIWVSGGLITTDFGLAMALTAIWMGLAHAASTSRGTPRSWSGAAPSP